MLCEYIDGRLHLDGVDLQRIAAAAGTPCHVYSRRRIEDNWRAYDRAFGERAHRVCYAVKANDNLSILRTLHRAGASFDIVSGGELARVLAIGADAAAVVFSGVGKTTAEIESAVAAGVGCINLESAAELERVAAAAAAAGCEIEVAVRVNPDVDAGTHPYISTGLKENKFGVPIADAPALYERIAATPGVRAGGIACHIGSQLTSIAPVVDAVRDVVELAEALAAGGRPLGHIDVGGGLGISYQDEAPPPAAALVAAMCDVVPARYTIVMEPGRSLVGPAGLMLTRVEYVKAAAAKNFVICDAAMNDLLRPSLYGAWHAVHRCEAASDAPPIVADLVGPVCESGDWLARDRELAVAPGDLLAIMDTGAYVAVMASNYNARPRAAEVLVADGGFAIVRGRDSIEALLANEQAHLIEN